MQMVSLSMRQCSIHTQRSSMYFKLFVKKLNMGFLTLKMLLRTMCAPIWTRRVWLIWCLDMFSEMVSNEMNTEHAIQKWSKVVTCGYYILHSPWISGILRVSSFNNYIPGAMLMMGIGMGTIMIRILLAMEMIISPLRKWL
jgi:hypothetical protein